MSDNLLGFAEEVGKDVRDLESKSSFDNPADARYEYAFADSDGRVLIGFKADGTTDIPGFSASGNTGGGLYFAKDGSVRPSAADLGQVTTWGSSTLDYADDILINSMSPFGVAVNRHAKGGEWIEHSAARLGSDPALIKPVTIPASGAATVEVENFPASMDFNYAMKTYDGTIAGVHGTLSATREQFTFTRTSAGEAVTLAESTPLIPSFGPSSRSHVTLLAAGKNNLTQSATAQEDVIAYTDRMVEYLTPERPHFLILGNHNNTGWSNESIVKQRIRAVNAYFAERYGPLFIDIEALCTSPEIWDRVGITPTSEDLQEQDLGNLPPSLARDTLHFNDEFNAVLVEEIITRMQSLGWY